MSFLVTAYGRSGTKFLSSVMNRSRKWTVLHEPRGATDYTSYRSSTPPPELPKKIREPFAAPHYGEVNGYLRNWFMQVPATRRGVITRDADEVVLSVANRREPTPDLVKCVVEWQERLQRLGAMPSVLHIDFAQMTTSHEYLHCVLAYFGITDVDVGAIDLQVKVNAGKRDRYTRVADLPGWALEILELDKVSTA